MQNDRNVSSNDNKNAISLDNIIDQYGDVPSKNSNQRTGKLGDAMKKLDEMFEREAEDLAWLDNIMNNGVTAKEQPAQNTDYNVSTANSAVPENAFMQNEIMPENAAIQEESIAQATAVFEEQPMQEAQQDIVPDLSVMPREDAQTEPAVFGESRDELVSEPLEKLSTDDDIFDDNPHEDMLHADDEVKEQEYEEIIIAENADPNGEANEVSGLDEFYEEDDTKIFTSSAKNQEDVTVEGYQQQNYQDSQEFVEQPEFGQGYPDGQVPENIVNEPVSGGAPDFEMFEGTQPEGEYVHNVEMAAQQQESNVNSSLGKLFGVDIPDEDEEDKKKSEKKRSEHKKIAKALGAYEEINMADPDAVGLAKRYFSLKRRHSMISLFGATFFFLVSLYFELSMLGVLPIPEIVSVKANPLIFALMDLQIMCFGAICVIDSLIGGFYSLLDKKFSPASCALTVFITCTVQAVVSAVFASSVKIELFCCIGCLSLFMLALYESLRASADNKSFNIASSTANKYGAYELGVDSLECSPFASHIDLEKAKVISVNKGSVYEGFVGRNEKRPIGEKKLGRLVAVITIISVLVAVFVALFSDGNIKERIYDGITGASIVITSSIPLNIFFVSALPKYLAIKKGKKIGATLIGQNASEEYKGLSVVAFEDTEVFLPKDVRISSIKTYGGMALDEAVITMSSIYNKIGGPLSKIFSKMVDVKNVHSEVRLVKVYPDAIEVNVDGRDICLATASYLGANGIRIISDSVDAAFEQSHGSILFMVCSGRILSKFYIKYSMNPIFEKTLRELHDANLCIGIKTLDPCITNDLVFGCLERTNYALSVIKGSSSNDIPTVRNKVNSGVISLGSVHSFLEMLIICEKTGRNVKINNVIRIISTIMCIALSTVFVLANNGSLNIIFCLLIQLFWLLPVTAVSYFNR